MASGTVHSNLQLILFVLHMSIIAIVTHFKFWKPDEGAAAVTAVVSMYGICTLLALINFILFSIRKTRNAIPPIAVLVIMCTLFILDLVNIILIYAAEFQLGVKCPKTTNTTTPGSENNERNLIVYFTAVTMVLALIEGLLLLLSPPSIGVSEKELERRRKMDDALKTGLLNPIERAPGDMEKKDENNEGDTKTPNESKPKRSEREKEKEKEEAKEEKKEKEEKTEGADKKEQKSKSQKSQKSSKKSNRKDP